MVKKEMDLQIIKIRKNGETDQRRRTGGDTKIIDISAN
jgi:hypothetical protein